jgi:hypothetical protein
MKLAPCTVYIPTAACGCANCGWSLRSHEARTRRRILGLLEQLAQSPNGDKIFTALMQAETANRPIS